MIDEEEEVKPIKIGGLPAHKPREKSRRMSMLLWGLSKCGKTTLAATAPGLKLWLTFDVDGTVPISIRDDVIEVDYSAQSDSIVEKFREANAGAMRDLDRLLAERPDIETVVCDSVTTFGDKALHHGVVKARSTTKGKSSTLEDPGFAGHGNKNTWMRLLVSNLLEITLKHNRHIIIIAHEDKPTKDKEGYVLFTTIMVGSSLAQQIPININEVWHMEDTGKKRRIQIRPCRGYKPMGTRMFVTTGEAEFVWDYDADAPKGTRGDGIATWFNQWKENNHAKIKLPS